MPTTYEPNYVVGRGRTYFGQFINGTNRLANGELYFGNTPELTLNTDSENLDHYSSESGLRNLDMTVLLEMTRGGSFTVDEINSDNHALFFLGDKSRMTQTQVTGKREVIASLVRGRSYQLGMDNNLPTGVRDIDNVQIVVADAGASISTGTGDITTIPGVTVLNLAGNVEVDLALGRIYIEPDAPDVGNNLQAVVQYDVNAQTRTTIISRNNMIYGCLRFISDNPVGQQRDFFWPKVALQPDGDYALKGDDWQSMSFSFRALKLNSAVEHVYIDERNASTGISPADQRSVSVTVASTTGTVGTPVTATVVVRDGYGNIVPGVKVNLTSNSGTTVSPTTGTTSTSGTIDLQISRNAAGSATVTATVDGTSNAGTSQAITFAAAGG